MAADPELRRRAAWYVEQAKKARRKYPLVDRLLREPKKGPWMR